MAFTTKKSLLARVRSGDEISWKEFYETYRPLIYLVGNDCGLDNNEKEDLVQQVMAEIFKKKILNTYDIEKVPENITFTYDPAKGRFRHFLRAIIRNQALKFYKANKTEREKKVNLVTSDATLPMGNSFNFDLNWEEEWKKHLFTQAIEELKTQVKAVTYSAFEMYALQNRPVNEVADFHNLSTNSVYVAKNRCIAALKKIIQELDNK